MKWSIRLGKAAGIDVYVHGTFLILLAWIALLYYSKGGFAAAAWGLLFILLLFGIIVLHELGHALTARRFGIRTRDITLLPIGGMARLERMPENPVQELLVALAGPAVNVALALFLGLALAVLGGSVQPEQLQSTPWHQWPLLPRLIGVNIMLAFFNLLPAFPMDGGRVLRALLAMRMDYVKATQIAAHVGQGMALLFGLVGLIANPFLIFIALFVWLGAAGEAGMVQMRSTMGGIPISRAMVTDFRTLAPSASLAQAVDHLLAGFQQDFPIVYEGEVIGMLTRRDLMTALKHQGEQTRVADVMHTDFLTADPSEMMEQVFARLSQRDCRSLPIVQGGQLVGLVTMDNLGEFLMVDAAHHR